MASSRTQARSGTANNASSLSRTCIRPSRHSSISWGNQSVTEHRNAYLHLNWDNMVALSDACASQQSRNTNRVHGADRMLAKNAASICRARSGRKASCTIGRRTLTPYMWCARSVSSCACVWARSHHACVCVCVSLSAQAFPEATAAAAPWSLPQPIPAWGAEDAQVGLR